MAVIKLTQPVDSQVGFLPVSTEILTAIGFKSQGIRMQLLLTGRLVLFSTWGHGSSIKDNLIRYRN